MKVGGSALYGPRNDQRDSHVLQHIVGGDLRLACAGFYLSGEYVRVDEDQGQGAKTTSLGVFPLTSGFHARGFYGQLAYALAVDAGALHKVTVYGRYEQRNAWFEGFTHLTVDRITAGLRLDLWDALIVKGEILVNRELEGAPSVPNNVQTVSLVYSY
jgi:hypothetical protein